MLVPTALAILIRELGEKMYLGNLSLDADGACAVNLDKRFIINFQYRDSQDQLWLYADLGVPADGEAIYYDLLRGNLFWDATKGATISLSLDDPSHIIMTIALKWKAMDCSVMAKHLESFVNTVEDWSTFIAASSSSGNGIDMTPQNQTQAQNLQNQRVF
ncbi:hypothetical protein HC248_02584 [Polaromonas vacuolata]|uniref:Uncharacterized protein n=1 Tax=Polaromonas vacuolata TaxID=37448 RepID=A0A6H2HBU2_9BURK|nr:type III secretion system chaperone [Polaromonas vacuolata]QJC57263.1 hypothetical protein HC248_02584 [Polaromonas vacuolata]